MARHCKLQEINNNACFIGTIKEPNLNGQSKLISIHHSSLFIQNQINIKSIMSTFKWVGVGAVLLTLGLGTFFFPKSKPKPQLTRNQTISMLIKIRIEFYPTLLKICAFVTEQLVPKGVPPNENQQMVQQHLEIQKLIQESNNKIYADISEEELTEATEVTFKNDEKVHQLKHQFQEEYQKCLLGVHPAKQISHQVCMNKQVLLECVDQALKAKILRMKAIEFAVLSESDRQQFLETDIDEEEKTISGLMEEKLGFFITKNEDSWRRSLEFCIARYMLFDAAFKQQYTSITKAYSDSVKELSIKVKK